MKYLLNKASCEVAANFEKAVDSEDKERERENECRDMGGSARSCRSQLRRSPLFPVRKFSGEANSEEAMRLIKFIYFRS